jgi:hypothetical protein
VEATSLAGPWRVEGSYLEGDVAVPFRFATGRRLADGTIRLKGDVSPAQWPVSASADGVVSLGAEGGLAYAGSYSVTEVVDAAAATTESAPATDDGASAGWRSEGTFALSRDRLTIDKAVLSSGPPDKPTSLAGSLTLNFGRSPSFDAVAESRQLDLDRAFGGGPDKPIEVAAAANTLVGWLARLPVPPIPGRLAFSVPGIVVGGSVIQDVAFNAEPATGGWRIEGLRAHLPGQATLSADGLLTTGKQTGFAGTARLAALQPSTFAAWWRGRAQQVAGRQLSAFDIAGKAVIGTGRFSLDNIQARIGDATISGRIAWSENARDHHRDVGTDLKADRIDFLQVKALADLLVGRNLNEITSLADSFSILIKTDLFQLDDIRLKDVSVDVGYADDRLTVTRIDVGDLGGASFRATSGRIDGLTTKPHGLLEATLEAKTLDGLALIAGKLAPDSGILPWLGRMAPSLTPAIVKTRITAPAGPDGTGIRVAIENGVAGSTSFNLDLESTFRTDWRDRPAMLSVSAHSPDSADLARLLGLTAVPSQDPQGADITIHAAGVPGTGLDTQVDADIAGLTAAASGKLKLASSSAPDFDGTLKVATDDLDPFVATAGLAIPGADGGTRVAADGTLAFDGASARLTWKNGMFGSRVASGDVRVARPAGQGWRIDGDLSVDTADLEWLMALGLGVPPVPDFSQKAVWAKTPFEPPGYGSVGGKLAVTADHLTLDDGFDVANARLSVVLQPQRIDVDLADGHLNGATVSGGMSIHNVDGNANVAGRFNLQGAPLEAFTWQRDGRSVATGTFDLSANFEATGRSPAGLVSSMTGGGVLAVRDGEARYINPNSAKLVIRASDLDQEFSDEALRMTLAERIDADSLKFGETGGAFSLAAGAVRLKGLAVRAKGVEGMGDTVLDLNTMMLDSDWTLTFDPGDTKVEGTNPQVGVVFRGPVGAPTRTLDILPFSSYLNTRREARILEILATEEADRREREFFSRVMVKIRQDHDRADREAREAAEAEARRVAVTSASLTAIAGFHVEREIAADDRAAAALTRMVEQTSRARDAAAAAAAAAAKSATAARAAAEQALASRDAAAADADRAAKALADARQQSATLQAAAQASADSAHSATATSDAAMAEAAKAADAESAATSEAGKADAAKKDAEANLDSANSKAEEAAREVAAAEAANTAAQGQADAAGKAMDDAVNARDAADTTLAAAQSDLQEAQDALGAIAKGSVDELRAAAAAATLERSRAEELATAAADKAATARARLDEATGELNKARAAADAADQAVAKAQTAQQLQTELSGADAQTEPGSLLQQLALQTSARKAEADKAKLALISESAAHDDAAGAAGAAAADAASAQRALDAASEKATAASAAFNEAAAGNTAAQKAVADRTAALHAAGQDAADRRKAAQRSGEEFASADAAVRAATDRAVRARAAARIASAEKVEAAAAVATTASDASAAAFRLEAAKADHAAAASAAATAGEAAAAAQKVADADAAALAKAVAAENAAGEDAAQAAASRDAAEKMVAETAAAVERATADAAEAAAVAKEKTADAAAAAARAGLAENAVPAPVPSPRPRRQPLKVVPDALAGEGPLLLVPPN